MNCSFGLYVDLLTGKKLSEIISVDRRCWRSGCVENNVARDERVEQSTLFKFISRYRSLKFDLPDLIIPIDCIDRTTQTASILK